MIPELYFHWLLVGLLLIFIKVKKTAPKSDRMKHLDVSFLWWCKKKPAIYPNFLLLIGHLASV